VPTKAFVQPSPDTAIIFRVNLPTSPCPTLSAGTGPISQEHGQKWLHKSKVLWCIQCIQLS